jgi:HEAT repeat protein
VLLAIARSPAGAQSRIALAIALGRIKDARALPVLAAMAEAAGDDLQGAQAAVNAFCWISGRCPAREPAYAGGAVDPSYLRDGLAAIATWRAASRPKSP